MTEPAPLDILVCVKFVPDPNQLRIAADGGPDLEKTPYRINTFDENAIEAALQLRSRHGGRVVALSLAPKAPPRDILLRALAMGLDTIHLVIDPEGATHDPLRVGTILAAAVRAVGNAEGVPVWDLLLCGEASVDEYNAQVGPRVAAALGLPAITFATRLDIEGRALVGQRGLEDRTETVEADLPALATVGMEINQARMPTVLQIMGAGRKPVREIPIAALPGLDRAALARRPTLRTVAISSPAGTRKNIVITGETVAEIANELLRRLGADGEVRF